MVTERAQSVLDAEIIRQGRPPPCHPLSLDITVVAFDAMLFEHRLAVDDENPDGDGGRLRRTRHVDWGASSDERRSCR
jgi:hypothetical protein